MLLFVVSEFRRAEKKKSACDAQHEGGILV